MTPVRIQRQRTKGWRMPEGAIYVGRPSMWGNSERVGGRFFSPSLLAWVVLADAAEVVSAYRDDLGVMTDRELADWIDPLRGHDLANRSEEPHATA